MLPLNIKGNDKPPVLSSLEQSDIDHVEGGGHHHRPSSSTTTRKPSGIKGKRGIMGIWIDR